jgi:hypothetical protein
MSLSSSVSNATLNIAKTQYSDGTSQTTAYVPLNVVGVVGQNTIVLNTSSTGALTPLIIPANNLPQDSNYLHTCIFTITNISSVTGNLSVVFNNIEGVNTFKYSQIKNLTLIPNVKYQFQITVAQPIVTYEYFEFSFTSTDATVGIAYTLEYLITSVLLND